MNMLRKPKAIGNGICQTQSLLVTCLNYWIMSKKKERVKTITRYYSGDISVLDESERTPVEVLTASRGG